MSTASPHSSESSVRDAGPMAMRVAPEDLRVGDRVAILNESIEFPSFLWGCDAGLHNREAVVRVTFRSFHPGVAYRVKSVCLPFVALKAAGSCVETIDVRCTELVRISDEFADAVKRTRTPDSSHC